MAGAAVSMIRLRSMAFAPTGSREDSRLATFLDDVYEREVADRPIEQAQLGRKTDMYGEWDDFSDAHEQECVESTAHDLEKLDSSFSYDLLSDGHRLSYDVFKFNAELRLSNFQYRYHDYLLRFTDEGAYGPL